MFVPELVTEFTSHTEAQIQHTAVIHFLFVMWKSGERFGI